MDAGRVGKRDSGQINMEIAGATQFRGGFPEPTAVLIDSGVYPYEVHSGKVDMIAIGIDSPRDIE